MQVDSLLLCHLGSLRVSIVYICQPQFPNSFHPSSSSLLLSRGLSGVFPSTRVLRHQFHWHSAFFTVKLSQLYMITGKTIALTYGPLLVMSLLFNILSRFVITFLPRTHYLLISWLQSPSAVIFEPKKRKSVTASTFSHSICHEVMGPDDLSFFNIES